MLLGVILSSLDSIVWLLFASGTREFSNGVILRNALAAGIYAGMVDGKIVISKLIMQQLIAFGFAAITCVEICVYGIDSPVGIDITFLTQLRRFAVS
jgi:hypothetical protein